MSRQNSRDVSSLEVTINGHQVAIDPVANGTKTIDDVKVMLCRGSKGNGIVSIEKTGTDRNVDTYTITYDDGNTDTFTVTNADVDQICQYVPVYSSGWSNSRDADGYYTNAVTLSAELNTAYQPLIALVGASESTLPTNAQKTAFSLVDVFYFADGTNISQMTVKAKTTPTTTFYVAIFGGDDTITVIEPTETAEVNCAVKFLSTGWSSTVNASGYYSQSASMSDSVVPNAVPDVSLIGSNGSNADYNALPTSAEASAYNLVDYFYMVDSNSPATAVMACAKTKPTTTFFVNIKGVSRA